MEKHHKKEKPKKGSKIKKTLMAIAIALVLAFFVGYGVNTFYKEPKWEDYCQPKIGKGLWETKESCEAAGGNWTAYENAEMEAEPVKLTPNQYLCTKSPSIKGEEFVFNCISYEDQQVSGWCDPDYLCRTSWEKAIEPHNRVSFIILAVIGVIIIAVSTIIIKDNVIGYGTLAGGILTVLYGTMRYWGSIPDIARFSILGVVLVVLIVIAWKKLIK